MNQCKRWAMLVGLLLLPSTAACVDPKTDAFQKGNDCLEKGDWDSAIALFTEVIRDNPRDDFAYNNRGFAYEKKGDFDKAISDYSEAIRSNPKLAGPYNSRGWAYWNKGEYGKAISDYDEAIRIDPRIAPAYNNRGMVFELKGEYNKAIAEYTEAIRLDRKLAIAYYNRALAQGKHGENDKAIVDFDEAIRCNPKFAEAYCNRSLVYWNRDDYDKAVSDGMEAVRLDPRNAFSHNNLGWFLATCAEDRLRDGKQAVQHATQACELTNWKDGNFIATLAAAYAEAGEFDKAIQFQQKAIERATMDADKKKCQERLKLYQIGRPYRESVKKK